MISTWILFSLSASMFFGIVNILDQRVLTRYNLSPWAYFVLDGLIGVVVATIPIIYSYIDPQQSFLEIPSKIIILSLSSGIALSAFNLLYFFALQISEVTIVSILTQLTPVFSLVWGLLLKEKYLFSNYLGMALILLGSFVATISDGGFSTKESNKGKPIKAGLLMVLASCSLSVCYLVQSIALKETTTSIVFLGQRMGLLLMALLVLITRWKIIKEISSIKPVLATSSVEILVVLGTLCMTLGLSSGPLGAVAFLASLQPVWVLAITTSYSSIILKNKKPLNPKVFQACLLVLIGLYLINLRR